MAQCLEGVGELGKAAKKLQEILDAAPDNVEAKMKIATLYEELGEQDRALQFYSEGSFI